MRESKENPIEIIEHDPEANLDDMNSDWAWMHNDSSWFRQASEINEAKMELFLDQYFEGKSSQYRTHHWTVIEIFNYADTYIVNGKQLSFEERAKLKPNLIQDWWNKDLKLLSKSQSQLSFYHLKMECHIVLKWLDTKTYMKDILTKVIAHEI